MKIAILGYGVEGKSAYQYLRRHHPDADIDIFDQKSVESDAPIILTEDLTTISFADYDTIIRSPSVNPGVIPGDLKATVTSSTQIFFDNCPAPIIGVTGTKGKGTTCSMIKSILDAAHQKSFLVGNIGTPAIDILDDVAASDIMIYEMSSFQLWDLKKSPSTAVVLTIAPDHLDVHSDFAEYVEAKSHIATHQSSNDTVIYYAKNDYSRGIAELSPARQIAYPSATGAHITDANFCYGDEVICPTSTLNLPGAHNQENALAAISSVWGRVDISAITEGLRSFQGLPHRLELVRELDSVKYYDDSFSSATPALEVALKAFAAPVILIAGGFDRGLKYHDLDEFLLAQTNLKKLILIGQTSAKIAAELPPELYEFADTLESAVTSARAQAVANDIVLLSPGCASFDMFRDFKDRGEKYQKIVKELS